MAEESAEGSSPMSAAIYEPIGENRRPPSFRRHLLRLAAGLWVPVVAYVAWRTAFSGFSPFSGHLGAEYAPHRYDSSFNWLLAVPWFVYSLAMLGVAVSVLPTVFSSDAETDGATGRLTIAGCLSLVAWGLLRLFSVGSFSAQWPWMIAWTAALGIQIGLLYLWEAAEEAAERADHSYSASDIEWSPILRGDVFLSQDFIDSHRTFGIPGGGQASVETFGRSTAQIGSYGERVAATLLEDGLADIPEARIFHQLRFPGSERADVDHAVAIGDTVVLVDAKVWKPAVYTWSRFGSVLRDGREFKGGDNHMAAAVARYEDLLPTSARVVALLVFIPPTEHKSASVPDEPAWHEDTVALTTPATLIDTIKQLAPEDRSINRRVVTTLYENLI